MDIVKKDLLKPYEAILKRALYGNYTSCTQREFEEIVRIHSNNYIDYTLSKSAFSCGRCRLNELKRIAKDYEKLS